MRVLLVGGYGFIGLEIARRLNASGHDVTGLGRSAQTGTRLLPGISWVAADIATLDTPAAWRNHVVGFDVVVNASGALQSNATENLAVTQGTAIVALIAACEMRVPAPRFIQISAPNATPDANTEFMRTKAIADHHLAASALDWVILRPGLVLGPNAYGGSALLRMLASIPLVQPLVFADRLIQTVAISDVTAVALSAVKGQLPARSDFDLVEAAPHSLEHLVNQLRLWLGIPQARQQIAIPPWLALGMGSIADALGYLGWRSPLRTTTLKLLAANVVGDPARYRTASGRSLMTLSQTLAAMPSTLQERWFARLYLIMPLAIATLSAFWLLTGLIAVINLPSAVALVADHMSPGLAKFAVLSGAITDIGLGAAILYRPWARFACLGMVVVTLAYLVGGTILRPDLWLDPLGPLLKTLPAIVLAAVVAAMAEPR